MEREVNADKAMKAMENLLSLIFMVDAYGAKCLTRQACDTTSRSIDAAFPLADGANEVQAIGVAVESVQQSEDEPGGDDGDWIDEQVFDEFRRILARNRPLHNSERVGIYNAVRKDRELRDKTSTPSPASQRNDTLSVLTDEELRRIYDAEEDEAPDEFTIEDGLRAVATAQRERDRVRVSRAWLESLVRIGATRDTIINDILADLRSLGATVEDQQ